MPSNRWRSNCTFQMNSEFRPKRKRQSHSPCSRTRHGIGGQAMCPRLQEQNTRRSWERSRMRKAALAARTNRVSFASLRVTIVLGFLVICVLQLLSCSQPPDPNTFVMIIESSPTNLDPRVGIDAQSERIDELLFDDLLSRADDLNVAPGLAQRW